VTGAGPFNGGGDKFFEGSFSPGTSPAAVALSGDVSFGADSTLVIELGGILPGSEHDQVQVDGELSLGGTLEVSLIDGFAPSAGQSFDVLDWTTLSGAFSSISLPALAGLAWDTSALYETGALSVGPALSADFDSDGEDFLRWQRQLGGVAPATPVASAVPEPASRALSILAAAGFLTRRRQPWRLLVEISRR
jgi:hypothetical protein